MLFSALAFYFLFCASVFIGVLHDIMKRKVSCSEIHGRSYSKLEMGAQSKFSQYSDRKSRIPSVLIDGNVGVDFRSILDLYR